MSYSIQRDLSAIIPLRYGGMSIKEIAAETGYSYPHVNQFLRNNDPKHIIGDRVRFRPLNDGKDAQCKHCKRVLPLVEFRGRKVSEKIYTTSTCRGCRNTLKAAGRDRNIFKYRAQSIRGSSKAQGHQCSITEEHLHDLYTRQKETCFYTNALMILTLGPKGTYDRDALSVDKIVPTNGYTMGNVVLCTRKVNTVKNDLTLEEIGMWMPDWRKRIDLFLSNNPWTGTEVCKTIV